MNVKTFLRSSQRKKRKETYEAKAQEKFNKLCEKVSKELLKQYYIEENHSLVNTYTYLEI